MQRFRASVACACLVAVSGLASAHASDAWKTFKSPSGTFSVKLPGTPRQTSQDMDQPMGGKIHLTMFVVAAKPLVYIVSDSTIDKDSPALSAPEAVLSGVETGYANSTNSKVLSSTKTKIQGFPAHRMVLQGPTMLTKGITLIAGNHNYTVVIASGNGKLDQATVDKFLNSFKVLK